MLSFGSSGLTRSDSPGDTASIVTVVSVLRKKTSSWPEPACSVGRFIRKYGSRSCWEAIGPARQTFSQLGPEIRQYLEQCSEPLPSWVTWSIYMIGKTPETAVPTIIFCSEDGDHRRQVRNFVKRSGILRQFPGVSTGDMPRAPDFDQLVQLATNAGSGELIDNPHESEKQPTISVACQGATGMRIVVEAGEESSSLPRQATVGGVVVLGKQYCYMTAGHVMGSQFEQSSDSHVDTSSEYDFDSDYEVNEIFPQHDVNIATSQEKPGQSGVLSRPRSLSHSETNALPSPRQELDERATSLQLPRCEGGYEARSFSSLVTLSDKFDNQVPGILHISSLNTKSSGLDYALVSSSESNDRLASESLLGRATSTRKGFVDFEWFNFDSTEVLALKTLGNYLPGRLQGTPSFSSFAGSQYFQKVYVATFQGPLEPGDCGTWVAEPKTGKLVGHIVAGCTKKNAAFIVPAYQVFENIASRTGSQPSILVTTSRAEHERTGQQVHHLPISSSETDNFCANSTAPASTSADRTGPLPDYNTPNIETSTTSTANGANLNSPPRGSDVDPNSALLSAPTRGLQNPFDASTNLAHELTAKFKTVLSNKRRIMLTESARQARLRQKTISRGRKSGCQRVECDDLPKILNLPVMPTPPNNPRSTRFQNMLNTFSEMPIRWENSGLLDQALSCVPLQRIYDEAEEESQIMQAEAESLNATTKTKKLPAWGYQDCVIRSLMRWFKSEFFSWVNNPACSRCASDTIGVGMATPTPDEWARGTSQVELYKCSDPDCASFERFPRYNDAYVLIMTRKGRVGEWVNCFGMLCRAVGARVRWVWNSEDHVWLEVHSTYRRRWVHVDVCEQAWDRPTLYTIGWQRQLSYCIAFSVEGAVDVTTRYTRQRKFCADRARAPEGVLAYILESITNNRRSKFNQKDQFRLKMEDRRESRELQHYVVSRLVADLCGGLCASPSPSASKISTPKANLESFGDESNETHEARQESESVSYDAEHSFVESRCDIGLDPIDPSRRIQRSSQIVDWLS